MKNPHAKGEGASKLAGSSNASTLEPTHTQTSKQSPQAKWKNGNPKAVWAHACLRAALRRGLIERKACSVCGAEPTDAHHDDYDTPMKVVWLCRRCHKAVHQRRGERGRS